MYQRFPAFFEKFLFSADKRRHAQGLFLRRKAFRKVQRVAVEPADQTVEDVAHRPGDVAVHFLQIVETCQMRGQLHVTDEFVRRLARVHAFDGFVIHMLQRRAVVVEYFLNMLSAEKRFGMAGHERVGAESVQELQA